jgi:hypothetical protein
VVLLADVGEVDVADLVAVVERKQQTAVTDRNIAWHGRTVFVVGNTIVGPITRSVSPPRGLRVMTFIWRNKVAGTGESRPFL